MNESGGLSFGGLVWGASLSLATRRQWDVCCFVLDEKPDGGAALIPMTRTSKRGATKGV
jgi:hypothetical protein